MMEPGSSGPRCEPGDIQSTTIQEEVLELLRRLVDLVASDVTMDIRNLHEVRVMTPVKARKMT